MPTGWLLYGKAPRLRGGNLSLGVEVWRDRRRRDFYEADGTHAGYTKSDAQIVKSQILYPLLVGRLQAGLHVESAWEQPSTFQSEGGERPLSIVLNNSKQQSYQALPMMVLDTIYIEGLSYEGVRLSGKWGPQFAPGGERNRVAEGEFFGFVSATNDLSLASHLYLGSTTSRTLKNTFFLGGFDSVRGLPDGIHFGNQLAYGNSEIRHRGLEWKYLHMQHVLFADAGSAFFDSKEAKENFEWSTGVGLRFAVPQVYRLMLRIDYAWSLGSTRSQGISAGLNHFFQPYKLVY
jgi:outer membrane protein assembly factor BamA